MSMPGLSLQGLVLPPLYTGKPDAAGLTVVSLGVSPSPVSYRDTESSV